MSFPTDRSFQLWDYNVSHQQMLLRSPKSDDSEMNVDIVFVGVEYAELVTSLDGVAMVPPSIDDVKRAEAALGEEVDPSQVFCLASSNRRFLVVAAGSTVLTNNLDLFESSLEYFARADPNRNRGVVPAHSGNP